MRWEYGCLIRKAFAVDTTKLGIGNPWKWAYTFHFYSAAGITPIEGDASVEILNQLGRDGWEAFAIEPRYASFRENYGSYGPWNSEVAAATETLVERTTWFKRPLNTGTSR